MPQRKVILEELEALNTIKDLAESYEEIAVIRMQKIRDSVLKTRDFLAELSDIFVDLKTSYQREMKELLEKRQKGDKTIHPILQKPGKMLLVYLSSNGKLYGSVTTKTFRLFLEDIRKPTTADADIVIIGKAGREMYEGASTGKRFEYFDLPDTDISIDHIKKIVKKFLQYEKVYVYYGKFNNIIKQASVATSITGEDIFATETSGKVVTREDKFIFEPILEKIFHFFEVQIMANLFGQTLLENQLARHGSRVNAMEEALGHIEEEGKKLVKMQNQIKHQMQNKKQLETVSGVISLGM